VDDHYALIKDTFHSPDAGEIDIDVHSDPHRSDLGMAQMSGEVRLKEDAPPTPQCSNTNGEVRNYHFGDDAWNKANFPCYCGSEKDHCTDKDSHPFCDTRKQEGRRCESYKTYDKCLSVDGLTATVANCRCGDFDQEYEDCEITFPPLDPLEYTHPEENKIRTIAAPRDYCEVTQSAEDQKWYGRCFQRRCDTSAQGVAKPWDEDNDCTCGSATNRIQCKKGETCKVVIDTATCEVVTEVEI